MITLEKFPFSLRDLRSFKSAFRECKSLSGAGKDGGFLLFMKGTTFADDVCWWPFIPVVCSFNCPPLSESLGELICAGKWFNFTQAWGEWFSLNMKSTKSSLDLGVVLPVWFVQIQLYLSASISLLSMSRSPRIHVSVLRGDCMWHSF